MSKDNDSSEGSFEEDSLQSGDVTSDENQDSSEGSLLSQEEIDNLLGDGGDPEDRDPEGWQVLLDSSQITYERLPMLEVVFDRLVRLLSTSLRNFTSDIVEVSLKRTTSIRFGDYLDSIPLPALIGVFQAREWNTNALVMVDTSLIYAIVDVLLGGRRSPGSDRVEGRPYTTIETRLIERLIEVILADFTKAFEPVDPVTFCFDRMETNPNFATIVRPVNASILITIGLEIDGRGGSLDFLIPYSSLEPVRHKLVQMFMGERSGGDNIWESHFGQEVWQAEVSLEGILDQIKVPLSEALNWKKGSQISLRAKPDSEIALFSNGKLVLTGRMGQRNGNVSIQVDQNFIQKRKAS